MKKPTAFDKAHQLGMEAMIDAHEYRGKNPSRYTGDDFLKPVCAEGQHKPYKDALACEVCGSAVFGPGSSVRH